MTRVEGGGVQVDADFLPLLLAGFQFLTDRHEFVKLGGYPTLLLQGWDWYRDIAELPLRDTREGRARSHIENILTTSKNAVVQEALKDVGSDGGYASSDTSVKARDVRAACGRATNANQEVAFTTEFRWRRGELGSQGPTKWTFAELHRPIDERNAVAPIVVRIS